MPKKSARHVRESAATRKVQGVQGRNPGSDARAKHFRSVHIGTRNGRRWFSLKKRLGLPTDEDVAGHLLDLAESTARQENGCNDGEEWKADQDDEGTMPEAFKLDDTDEEAEEPLRRSPRKQVTPPAMGTRESPERTEDADPTREVVEDALKVHVRRSSRNKHHKSKTKHHKDKRKKRKHSRNLEDEASVDPNENDLVASVDGRNCKTVGERDESVYSKEEKMVETTLERLRNPMAEEESFKPQTEEVDRVEFIENVNSREHSPTDVSEKLKAPCKQAIIDKNYNTSETESHVLQNSHVIKSLQDEALAQNAIKKEVVPVITENVHSLLSQEKMKRSAEISDKNEETLDVAYDVLQQEDPVENDQDDRKLRKKRKRSKHEVDREGGTTKESQDTTPDDHTHKHRRKKHKHAGDHKNKKHHDVRKAPQDGIVLPEEPYEPTPIPNDPLPRVPEVIPTDLNPDHSLSEPQRLAIKIKVCQECNSRHLQDACPLSEPEYTIPDSITCENWLSKHSTNSEVQKAINSKDPMSEGYDRPSDDGFDSDEDTMEQPKPRIKVESEEKQLVVDKDRPIYARDSLPDCFELKVTGPEHGLGVHAKSRVPMYARLGPLVGRPVKEMDIPDDFSMRHIWEIDNIGKTSYISTTDPLRSNWIRYVRPAESKEERNVAVITRQGELHLVTTQNIPPGTELTYWADSQSSAWTRKNKMDKTNCGGCNLNFTHPIYYRLHCCIFHDTNYSLTIRKYHCKVCGAAVLGKDNIMKHAAELHAGRGAYQCQYCKKFFLRLNYLEMHRTYGCAQNPQRSRPLCDFCGRKFCQPQKLKVHIKRMHSDMSEVLREFQCKLCLKLLGSRAALQRHMKEVHHKDVVGAATCDRCGKMFQNKSNLKIHMLTHSGVKPFKCKENSCKAAFTTKQCLQFHYKKVHGLSEEMMPKIERSVAYTFDAYSGGLIEDTGRGKTPRMNRRGSQDNSNSLPSLDECSSESSLKAEMSVNSGQPNVTEFQNDSNIQHKDKTDQDEHSPPSPQPGNIPMSSTIDTTMDNVRTEVDLYSTSRLQSKGSKKWMGEFNPPITPEVQPPPPPSAPPDVYEFEDRKEEEKMTQGLMDESKLSMSVYRRTESSNASLLVEAALDAAERDIGAVSSPILEDNDRDSNLYSISTHLQSPMHQRSPETHLDSYIQQQEELMSPAPTPDNRHTPPNHMHMDYHLHRPVDYMNTRTHSIEQYLHHEDLPRVSSPNNYIHVQEDLVSPSATPNPRYQDVHHHQVPTDNLSSDEGDSVAQNLSLSVKEKALQLDLSTSYKYDALESDFGRERSNFEPLVLNTGELQGLDMSARGFHHTFGAQVQNTRYHHHLYEITERQSVDLSRTGGYSMSPPPPPPPPYPHGDVLRVVSLDLTPGGRHSVDLSLSRSHHIHGAGARMLTSPQPPGSSTPHVVPDTIDGRMMSPPPPPPPGYNPTYPVSPAPYHPPRPGYHHYSGYY